MASGKIDEARLRFAEANALVRSTDILWNLIAAELQSGHYADALNHARQFVRDPKAPANEVAETNIKTIPKATEKVGQIEVEAPTGAQIEIDGKDKVGHAPLLDPYALLPGSHQVVAVVGAQRLETSVDVVAGQTVHVALGSPRLVAPGATTADSTPSTAPVSPPPRAAAPTIDTIPQGPTPDHAEPSDTRKWVTLGFGAGAVLLAAGSFMFLSMSGASKDAASELQLELPPGSCPNGSGCAGLSQDLNNQNTYFHLGEGLAVGAGVAAVGALVSWLTISPRSPSRSALVVLPTATSSRPGFVVEGSF